MHTRPSARGRCRLDLPSTGYKLVEALLFQDLNAQIYALLTDADAVRARDQPTAAVAPLSPTEGTDKFLRAIRGDLVSHARDRRRMSHVARLTEAWAVHAFELTQLKDVTVKGSDDVFAGAKGRIAGVQGGHTVSSF